MTNQVIPAGAVEAAARVIFDRHHARYDWGSIGNEFKDIWRQDAKAALEAAAPHLMAANKASEDRLLAMAWSDGAMAATVNPVGARLMNPFRKKDEEL